MARADAVPDTFRHRHGALAAGVRQNHSKLVAAEPGRNVGLAGAAVDDDAGLDKRFAASLMAVGIVDLLETVQVEEQERQGTAAA